MHRRTSTGASSGVLGTRRGAGVPRRCRDVPAVQGDEARDPVKVTAQRDGVAKASRKKQQALQAMSAHFSKAIATGSPLYLSAASFYVGLAQWEYGDFVKNVRLPGT
jgi:hypothetical protein